MALCIQNAARQCDTIEDDVFDSDVEQCMIKQSRFKRQVSAPVKSSRLLQYPNRLTNSFTIIEEEEDLFDSDVEQSMIKQSLFKRQVSAPAPSSRLLQLANGLQNCKEAVIEPMEPELEPDIDEFECVPGPARQVSVMSDFSTKGPSRQVSAMSNWSVREWDSTVSTINRLQTEESWPTWNDTDPQLQSEQSCVAPHLSPCADAEFMTSCMAPYPSMGEADTMGNPIGLVGMMQTYGPLFAFQPVVQLKHENGSTRPPFQRKRESLIDLAKQREEQQKLIAGACSGKHEDDVVSSDLKVCTSCGGNVRPCFKFCVFCGNAV